jgi:hypothetical protein
VSVFTGLLGCNVVSGKRQRQVSVLREMLKVNSTGMSCYVDVISRPEVTRVRSVWTSWCSDSAVTCYDDVSRHCAALYWFTAQDGSIQRKRKGRCRN